MTGTDLILLGKVAATHGIKGQLRIVPYSGSGETFLYLKSVLLRNASGKSVEHDIAAVSSHGRKVLVALKGYTDINQVIPFVGSEVLIKRAQLPPVEEGEFYWHDLIGMQVVTDTGRSLGILESIIETGSNDVYVVTSGKEEILIPALEDVVVSIDVAAKKMTVTPVEGLFDL
ncbi:MAG: 16S rRNA processing protein RimM [Geobacter sp.]|nr:16S rRNA processing protein RimM [Geobacter sp.]